MAVNLIDNEQIHVIQNGSDITLDIQEDALKNKNVVVGSIRSKNIFNKANILNNTYLNISNQNKLIYDSNSISGYAKCKPNTTYTISKIVSAPFIVATCSTTPAIDTTIQQGTKNDSGSSITITTNSSAQYIVFWFYHTQYSTESYNDIINSIQVEEGSTATTYSPYQNLTGEENYSTGEQVIGTWVDGKPLYRMSFEANNPTSGGSPFGTLSISASQVKKIDAVCLISNGGTICLGYNGFWIQIDVANKLYYVNPNYTGTKLIVTIEYTKITD